MRLSALAAALLCGLAACSDAPSSPDRPSLTPAAPAATYAKGGVPVPGRYIVRFRNAAASSHSNADAVRLEHGGRIEREFTHVLNGAVMELSATELAKVQADSRVLAVEQDQVMSASVVQSNATWGLDRIDQRARPLNASYAYNVTGSGVTAYIIDTGINYAQADFGGRAFSGFDAVTAGGTATDCNGHGTHVAGTVGSTTYGVAKGVRLVGVRVLDCGGSGTTSGVISGIDWVTRQTARPAVANMSLGGGYSAALNTAVQNSIAAGVTYAIAAGNSAADACTQSPASVSTAITVGATSSTDAFASFSNYGSCVHLNAPGVSITSLWIGASGTTSTISGTSMASPHVAGTAALYLSANPSATPAQVKSALTGNATTNVITGIAGATPNRLLYEGFIGAPVPVAPVASFTSSCASLSCSFNASATQAQSNATYTWNFGDATSASGKTTSHSYAAAGTYTVTLTVSDAGGSSTKTSQVTVSASANQAPVAGFTWNCNTGYVRQCAMDASSSRDDVAIVSYFWDWGNGRSETKLGTTAKNTWATSGSYVVTLRVTDGAGLTNSVSQTVVVP